MSESVVLPRFNPFWTPVVAVDAKAQLALDDAVTALNRLSALQAIVSLISAGGGVIYIAHVNGIQKVPLRIAGNPGAYYIEFGSAEPL